MYAFYVDNIENHFLGIRIEYRVVGPIKYGILIQIDTVKAIQNVYNSRSDSSNHLIISTV